MDAQRRLEMFDVGSFEIRQKPPTPRARNNGEEVTAVLVSVESRARKRVSGHRTSGSGSRTRAREGARHEPSRQMFSKSGGEDPARASDVAETTVTGEFVNYAGQTRNGDPILQRANRNAGSGKLMIAKSLN